MYSKRFDKSMGTRDVAEPLNWVHSSDHCLGFSKLLLPPGCFPSSHHLEDEKPSWTQDVYETNLMVVPKSGRQSPNKTGSSLGHLEPWLTIPWSVSCEWKKSASHQLVGGLSKHASSLMHPGCMSDFVHQVRAVAAWKGEHPPNSPGCFMLGRHYSQLRASNDPAEGRSLLRVLEYLEHGCLVRSQDVASIAAPCG